MIGRFPATLQWVLIFVQAAAVTVADEMAPKSAVHNKQPAIAEAGPADARRQFDSLDRSIRHLAGCYGAKYRGAEFGDRLGRLRDAIMALDLDAWDRLDPARLRLQEEFRQLQFDALVAGNPMLSSAKLLFVKRRTYTPGWYYAEFMGAGALFSGPQGKAQGGLFMVSLPDRKTTPLAPQLAGGVFDRYDLSFDGRRAVFGYKPARDKPFRLYEAATDGSALRQLTFDPGDERQEVARYQGLSHCTTDDFHPCYLPDGGIAFASARCRQRVICDAGGRLVVNVLYRIDGDGGNLRRLSQGALSESTPSVMNDGRLLYTRWEYVDKGVIAVQSLWSMWPDGAASREVYGNDIADPMVFIHGRAIPGPNDLFVCTATFHHPFAVGPLLLVDTTRPINTLAPIRSLTPDTQASPTLVVQDGKAGERWSHWRNQQWVADNRGPLFSEPYPLADPETGAGAGSYFLASCNPDRPWGDPSAYALYLVDVFGNRVEIYHDPEISCWQPMPLRARPKPPVLPQHAEYGTGAESVSAGEGVGTLLMTNVYEGLAGVRRGAVKYIRVYEQVPVPWSARRFWKDDVVDDQHVPISRNASIHVKVLHGVVPVRDDGSALFTVGAGRNLFFQAIDEDFMEVQRMRTFVNLRPGETRTCLGCHEDPHKSPPPGRLALALSAGPTAPQPQPGEKGPRPIHYVTDVQPVLDRHCVRCHNAEKRDGNLDLTGTPTTFFNRSYESIQDRRLVACIAEFRGRDGDQFGHVQPLPAMTLGSHASKLIGVLRKGHYEVRLGRDEWVRLVTWADANAPFYGSYFGRRNLVYKGLPDFRPVPTLESALGMEPAVKGGKRGHSTFPVVGGEESR